MSEANPWGVMPPRSEHPGPPRRRWRTGHTIVLVLAVFLPLAAVTVVGLSGARTQEAQQACKADAQTVMSAIRTYHEVTGTWPPAGPVDKSSVLLLPGHPGLPYLTTAPEYDRYAINTDGRGGVLVAVPPARVGGINYQDAITGHVPGVKNPCDAVE